MLFFADPEGLQAQAEEGARFGYTGESVFSCFFFSFVSVSSVSPSSEQLVELIELIELIELELITLTKGQRSKRQLF